MIVFGTPVSEPDAYRLYAEPGIRAVAEADSVVHAFSAVGPIARGYNLLLEAAAAEPDLEALVLVHPHAEITDPAFLAKVRAALADPDVAVVGCAGATGVQGLAWWDGQVHAGPVTHRYQEHGGGELPAYAWADPAPAPAEVEALDGFLLALSPWAVRNVRFDEGLWLGPGFDVDFCLRVRELGRKTVVADLRVTHHRSLDLVGEPELWTAAHLHFAQKRAAQAGGEVDWKARARRAEAEREAARAVAYFNALRAEARIDALQRRFDAATGTASWRATAPLRSGNRRLREARARRRGA